MTAARRAALSISILVTALVALPGLAMAKGAELDAYGASAESYGVDVRVLPLQGFQVPVVQQGVLPDILDEYFPHTMARVDSLPHANADGEFFDPGGTVRVGPSLGNFFIGTPLNLYPGLPPTPCLPPLLPPAGACLPPVLADYPYIAQTTSSPADKRDVDASMGQPWTPEPVVIPTLTIPGLPAPLPPGFGVGSSHAHADASPYAQATGAVASVDLGQGVTVGSSKGESSAKQADGLVTAATTSTLTDVTIATLIHIASVTVTASITSAGPNTVKTSQQLVYSGVTVAGMPATIDNDGLHLAGSTLVQADQLKQVTDMLAPVLGPLHLSFVPPKTVETRNPDGSGKISVDGVGLLFYDDQRTDLSALVELGHSELKVRALPALPISIPTFVAPSLGDLGITTLTSAPPINTGVPGVGTHKTKRLTTITTVAGHVHLLILPFVALLAEISMVALVVQAYRWKREVVPDPQDLLAL